MENRITKYRKVHKGSSPDLGDIYFKSRWERNWARYLNYLVKQGDITGWEYESETFWFENIKRGVRSYTPDFRIWNIDGTYYWQEVKGWLDSRSKTKLKRFKKYYPKEILELIDKKRYRNVEKQFSGIIPNWEPEG